MRDTLQPDGLNLQGFRLYDTYANDSREKYGPSFGGFSEGRKRFLGELKVRFTR